MIEHVVIDGASRDATLEVIRAHPRQPEVLISEPDRGIYDALNKGIARATDALLAQARAQASGVMRRRPGGWRSAPA